MDAAIRYEVEPGREHCKASTQAAKSMQSVARVQFLMTQYCFTCGYRSANRDFFRRERGGLLGLRVTVCSGCLPYRASRYEQRACFSFALLLLVGAIPTFGWAAYLMGWPFAVVFLVAMASILVASTAIHELGHALAARIAGLHLISVTVGSGPLLTSLRHGDTVVELRRYLFAGGLTRIVDTRQTHSPWRQVVSTLGGPVANAITCGAAIVAAFCVSKVAPPSIEPVALVFFDGLAFWNGLTAIVNLVPSGSGRPDRLPRDGKRVLQLLLARQPAHDERLATVLYIARLLAAKRFSQAADTCSRAVDAFPDDATLLSLQLHCISRTRGDRASYEFFVSQRVMFERAAEAASPEPDAGVVYLCTNLAWDALTCGDPDDLAGGAQYAARAFAAQPDNPEIRAVQGLALIGVGQIEDGAAILDDAIRTIADSKNRGDVCAWRAKAARALGDNARADDFDRLGRHFIAMA